MSERYWLPTFFRRVKDGGPDSPVEAFWLVEWKALFSIGVLRFPRGSRENFHSHAMNAVSWVVSGLLTEEFADRNRRNNTYQTGDVAVTRRETLHRVWGIAPVTWVLTLRGRWEREWLEWNPASRQYIRLSLGRRIEGVYGVRVRDEKGVSQK